MTDKRVALDRDQVWHVIDEQRMTLADLLQDLSDHEWQQQSLCTGWTIRDVAAHLTLQQLGLGDVIATMAQWRGSLDRTIQYVACRRAAALTNELIISEIRGMVGSQRHNMGVTYLETLTDILVHAQDIAIPLRRQLEMPPQAAAVAASRVLTMRWPRPFPATRKLRAFRFSATDTTWSAGNGPAVEAPIRAILLLCTGRPVARDQLSGEGAPDLTARLSASAAA